MNFLDKIWIAAVTVCAGFATVPAHAAPVVQTIDFVVNFGTGLCPLVSGSFTLN